MSTSTLIVLAVLAPLASLAAPAADAVGTCSDLTQSWCTGYLLCIGYQSGPGYFNCTGPGVRDCLRYPCIETLP
jgi:hypothetical protein